MKMHAHIRALPGNSDALIINGVGDLRPEGITSLKPSDSIPALQIAAAEKRSENV